MSRQVRGDPTDRTSHTSILTAAAAMTLILLLVGSQLQTFGWKPSIYLHLGHDAPAIVSYVEERLPEVEVFDGLGHDGKYFFVQAHDPFLLNPETHAEVIDRPAYRYQRMGYAALAAPGLVAGESGLVWWLLIMNLIAVGIGTWITSRLAVSLGGSAWWGLSFGLNPGVIFAVFVDGAGAIALAFGMMGLWMVSKERWGTAVLMLTLAGLTREVMVVLALGSALFAWRRDRARSIMLAFAPLTSVAMWALYVRLRLGVGFAESQTQELGLPLVGLFSAARIWIRRPGLDLLVGLAVLAVCALLVQRLLTDRTMMVLATSGFVVVAIVLAERVWLHAFDIARALAPLLTGFVLVVASDSEHSRESKPDSGSRA